MYIARRTTTSDPPAPQPYHMQGTTMAIKDSTIPSVLLSHVSALTQLPRLLRAYQDLRCVR